jgi:hypothetical protein
MNTGFFRGGLISLLMFFLLSCGGGGEGGSGGGAASLGTSSAASGSAAGAAGTGTTDAAGTGTTGTTGTASSSGSAGGSTGASGNTDGSTSTASNGDGSGVGSGGTGVSTADAATSVGAVDGFGSIIVDGLRYNVDNAAVSLRDTAALQIGMTVAVNGPVDASFVTGVATRVTSAAELRGPVSAIDPVGGSFVVMGTTVTLDDGTVWGDVRSVADLVAGTTVQVWGLPATPGVLRATRVEQQVATTAPLVSGTVQQLDAGAGTFVLGGLTVGYRSASFGSGINAGTLANGLIVRVRADSQAVPGRLDATLVENWYVVPTLAGTPVQLEGVITGYASLGSFKLLGTAVDASAAQITGGVAASIGNGVKVSVSGVLSNGVLVATQLRIRHIPGAGALPLFTVIGPVSAYASAADFRVRGQKVDASAPGVVFVNGTVANLANGAGVTVVGTQVVNGVLVANQVTFN